MREIPGAWRRTAQGAGLLDAADSPAPTIFAEMTALATRTGAINLGQGFPDEDGPAEVLELADDPSFPERGRLRIAMGGGR